MYRMHRFAPLAHILLLVLLALLLSIAAGSTATAEAGIAAAPSAAPTVVKELVEERTANSETFVLSNGLRRTEIYGAPSTTRTMRVPGRR